MRTLIASLVGSVILLGCTKPETQYKDYLHLLTPHKVKGLDPIHADDLYSRTEISKLYEPLYAFHYLKRPYVVEPALAASMPDISKDGKVYKIKMKPGVFFADNSCFGKSNGKGREVIAEDVIFSWKRLADPRANSPMWWLFDGKIEGLNEWREKQKSLPKTDFSMPVAGLQATGPYDLEIHLVKKDLLFIYSMTMIASSVVAHEGVEKYGPEFIQNPVGTGPYLLTEFNPSLKIIYRRNPNYRENFYPSEGAPGDKEKGLLKDAGKRLPLSEGIVLNVFLEEQPRWLNFLDGKIDALSLQKEMIGQSLDADGKLKPEFVAKGIKLLPVEEVMIWYIAFNMDRPILGKNKLLRQAFQLALDNQNFIDTFFGGLGMVAQSILPPGVFEYEESYKNPLVGPNLEKAKELMKKAGYPEGKGLPVFDFLITSDSNGRQMFEWKQSQFAKLGVRLNPMPYTWPEFLLNRDRGNGDMFSLAWSADYPDAESFLNLFWSKRIGQSNDSRFRNAEFDSLYEQFVSLPSGNAKRTALARRMRDIVSDEVPYIAQFHRATAALNQKWLFNYKYHEFDHGVSKYYRIER